MTAPFPHRYQTDLHWIGNRQALLQAPPRPEIIGAPPSQFDGTDQAWSPEHLLLSSASLCLMLTYLALAERAKIKIEEYRSRTEGTLDRTESTFSFTRISVRVELRSPEPERAEALLQVAKKHCIISNSLKVPISLESAALV
ncbi:MAG: OsmC family protein [Elusimicrobia bacterium]|nr:OsmC family protein [Elusimicrobiota bacterium]